MTPPAPGDEVTERQPERHFEHTRPANRARQRDEHRTWLGGGADRAEPGGAEACDEREVRKGLDVLHQRRRTADTSLNSAEVDVRSRGGPPLMTHERGLLAGHEVIGNDDRLQRQLSVQSRRAALMHSARNARVNRKPNGDHDSLRLEHTRGDDGAVEDEMRCIAKRPCPCWRVFALRAVGHNNCPPALRGDGGKLVRRGKPAPPRPRSPTSATNWTNACRSACTGGRRP